MRVARGKLLRPLVLLVAMMVGLPHFVWAQTSTPFTLSGLADAVKKSADAGFQESVVVAAIKKRGVGFEVTAAAESRLKQAGATAGMIQAARANVRVARAAQPAAPARQKPTPASAMSSSGMLRVDSCCALSRAILTL